MYEIKNPSKFESFLKSLSDKKVIQIDHNGHIIIQAPQIFKELGFGFFLLWVHTHKSILRQHLPIHFINFGEDETLFLVHPAMGHPSFILPTNYRYGKFYLKQIGECFKNGNSECVFCHLKNSVFLNLSFFKGTNAFGKFLSKDFLTRLINRFPNEDATNCQQCKKTILDWIIEQIRSDHRLGIILGGYPIIIECPPDIFEIFFAQELPLHSLNREIGYYIDFFLATYLATKFQSGEYGADCKLSINDFYFPNEIDVLIVIKKNNITNLLCIETTSYVHDFDSLKNKVTTYTALKNSPKKNKFMYVYLTLEKNLLISLKDQLIPVRGSHPFDPIPRIQDFKIVVPSTKYQSFENNINSDWWDMGFLRESFEDILNKLDSTTDLLRIP